MYALGTEKEAGPLKAPLVMRMTPVRAHLHNTAGGTERAKILATARKHRNHSHLGQISTRVLHMHIASCDFSSRMECQATERDFLHQRAQSLLHDVDLA
jgi:hypothetical protein